MARGVGLDAGDFEVKVVELDGSPRKPRLAKVSIDAVAPGSNAFNEEHAAREAESSLQALKDGSVSHDNIALAFPCREAVLRKLKVPFVGADNIRKVIKFEVEGAIHSHNVDDMVVDFHLLEELQGETRVLVAGVPKATLRTMLRALEKVGIEPEVVDLDAMALFRAAEWFGAFAEAEGGKGANGNGGKGEEKPSSDPLGRRPLTNLVVHLGATSTVVLVVVGGKLVDVRALRGGADMIAEDIAGEFGIDLATARRAVMEGLRSGADFALEPARRQEQGQEQEQEQASGSLPAVPDAVPHRALVEARDRFHDNLQRELVRFITSVQEAQVIDRVWVSGGGSFLPGIYELLGETCGVDPQPLDLLSKLQHNLDAEEAASIGPRITVAVGLALSRLGGPRGLNFRQEDLAFARRFDRIKFPLAIACMLGLFFVLVLAQRSFQELQTLKHVYGATAESKGGGKGFTGFVAVAMGAIRQLIDQSSYQKLHADLLREEDEFKRLGMITTRLQEYERSQREKTGDYQGLKLEPGLAVLARMAAILQRLESQLGRYLVTEVEVELPANYKNRYLEFTVALREDFRAKYNAIKTAFLEDAKLPDSPFVDFVQSQSGEKSFTDLEANEEGAYLTLRMTIKPTFTVFQ
jgi:type IV pilus assembly protein PilM